MNQQNTAGPTPSPTQQDVANGPIHLIHDVAVMVYALLGAWWALIIGYLVEIRTDKHNIKLHAKTEIIHIFHESNNSAISVEFLGNAGSMYVLQSDA